MGIFILKRMNYSEPISTYDHVNGIQLKNAKGVTGFVKNAGLNMATSPVAIGGMIADNAKSKLDGALNETAELGKNYTPTVQNAYVNQKSYGVVQSIKQVSTGLAKGAWDVAKKNKGSLITAGTIGGAMALGSYASNRVKRQKQEIEEGTREANGLSTADKLAYGTAAVGAGAYTGYKTSTGHDKSVTKLNESVTKYKDEADRWKKATHSVNDPNGRFKKGDLLNENFRNRMSKKAMDKSTSAANELATKTGKKSLFGMNTGISNKSWKIGRNSLLVGGAIAGAGYLANKSLKQKQNSELEERQYGAYWGRVATLAKRAGGISKDTSLSKGIMDHVSNGNYSQAGKAAGTAIQQGATAVGKTVGNFLGLGSNSGNQVFNSMTKNLAKQGKYGKATADWMNRHKTTTKLVGAVGLGSAGFSIADSVANKSVNSVTSLDKKTSNYVKMNEGGQ